MNLTPLQVKAALVKGENTREGFCDSFHPYNVFIHT
jgi:hypothetical protein